MRCSPVATSRAKRQADRTQPGLPLKQGRAQTFRHDDVRHGTTTLLAALKVADGQVITPCQLKAPAFASFLALMLVCRARAMESSVFPATVV